MAKGTKENAARFAFMLNDGGGEGSQRGHDGQRLARREILSFMCGKYLVQFAVRLSHSRAKPQKICAVHTFSAFGTGLGQCGLSSRLFPSRRKISHQFIVR
jgi:hypothetical protein